MRHGLTPMVAGTVSVLAVVAGCGLSGQPSATNPAADRPAVVATTTVLADLVTMVGGDRVSVSSIVPRGGEVHTFDPSPSDAARLAEADLIVANGLGLDDWLADLAIEAGSTAPVVRLGEDQPEELYLAADGGAINPHLWLDPRSAQGYIGRIAEALVQLDPAGEAAYRAAADAARADLGEIDRYAADRFAAIPPEDRRIVSFHDALPYLARAYDIEIVGVVVAAPGQEPSAGEVAALIDEIRRTGARAVVSEAQFDDRVVQAIADEVGVAVVSDLYTDSLGDAPADTYAGLMRWDVDRLADALEGAG